MCRRRNLLRLLLAHPLVRGLEIDDPSTTERHHQIIQTNRFLRQIYEEVYECIKAELPGGDGAVLELGSGGGFLEEVIPGTISSEVFHRPGIRAVVNGLHLPFAAGSLRAIVLVDVFHHLPAPRRFLAEAARCVRPGGTIVMYEPWVTRWSRFIYARLHHEPFDPDAASWEFPTTGPLSSANGALPWIVFERDRGRFEREFPQWHLSSVKLTMPFRYLISGGVSMRGLMPSWSFGCWRRLELALAPRMTDLAMFAYIVLRRADGSSAGDLAR